MRRLPLLICVVALLASGCGSATPTTVAPTTPSRPTAPAAVATTPLQPPTAPAVVPTTPLQSPTAPAATGLFHSIDDCPVTQAIKDEPSKDPNADAFGLAYWYVNPDRTLWAGPLPANQSWHAGGEKVTWIRPQGTDLVITGERLDAEAPPLHADSPCCYP